MGHMDAFLFADEEACRTVSPATCAADIYTPPLILHSENDLRCPVEQAENLFATLRLLGRPV
jgi:dipeptidyl aminopeptidase/acylaminoacyl peptidase